MDDRKISVSATCIVANGAWVLAFALMGLGVAADRSDVRSLALMACGVAMTATIRTYFIIHARLMRNAFELGRDSVTALRRT